MRDDMTDLLLSVALGRSTGISACAWYFSLYRHNRRQSNSLGNNRVDRECKWCTLRGLLTLLIDKWFIVALARTDRPKNCSCVGLTRPVDDYTVVALARIGDDFRIDDFFSDCWYLLLWHDSWFADLARSFAIFTKALHQENATNHVMCANSLKNRSRMDIKEDKLP